ncbi:Uncharacterised protein [Bordetella pertussis]|nr:Uncharacterised protein [Bordetella pertussis]
MQAGTFLSQAPRTASQAPVSALAGSPRWVAASRSASKGADRPA